MMPTSLLTLVVFSFVLSTIVGAWIWVILRVAFRMPVLPNRKTTIVPWGAGPVLASLLLWMGLQIAVPIGYHLSTRPRPAGGIHRRELRPGELMALSAAQNASILVLVPWLLAKTSGARRRDFGLEGEDIGRQVGVGVVAYPLLAPLVFGAMGLAVAISKGRTSHPLENAILQDRSPGMAFILVLAGVVCAPMAEELIFRGVLLGWLTRVALGRKPPESTSWPGGSGVEDSPAVFLEGPQELVEIESPEDPSEGSDRGTIEEVTSLPEANPRERIVPLWLANLTVSLIFAALHAAVWPTPVPLFFLSLGLGYLYQRTGSIIAPIALHVTFNGISTLMMFLTLGAMPMPTPTPKPAPIPPLVSREPMGVAIVENSWDRFARPVDEDCELCYSFFPSDMDDVESSRRRMSSALRYFVPCGLEGFARPSCGFFR